MSAWDLAGALSAKSPAAVLGCGSGRNKYPAKTPDSTKRLSGLLLLTNLSYVSEPDLDRRVGRRTQRLGDGFSAPSSCSNGASLTAQKPAACGGCASDGATASIGGCCTMAAATVSGPHTQTHRDRDAESTPSVPAESLGAYAFAPASRVLSRRAIRRSSVDPDARFILPSRESRLPRRTA